MRGLELRHGICAVAAATNEQRQNESRQKRAEKRNQYSNPLNDFIVSR